MHVAMWHRIWLTQMALYTVEPTQKCQTHFETLLSIKLTGVHE